MTKPTTSGFSTDSYSMQPSTAQLNLLKTAYSNKGIKAHFDTGQLGGGNEVNFQTVIAMKQVENAPDFYNYKTGGDGLAAQFNANRYAFYHYVLLGYQYVDNDGSAYSSGGSYAGDDDTFIAYGLLRDTGNHSSFDTAIAGTILHELGHSLCLTGLNDGLPAYPDQPALCRYSGIDSSGGNSYVSSMNYSNQYSLVDYSSGVNGTVVDHDDWGAIRLFDFTNQQNLEDPYAGGPTQNKIKVKKVKTKLIKGPSIDSKKISITTR